MLTFELQCSRCFGATMADVLNAQLLHTKPRCRAKNITRLNYDFGYTNLPAFITAQQRKRNESPLRWSAIVKLDQWWFWASINQRRCQKYSACSRCATARGSWKIVEDLCSFPYLSAIDLSVIQSWGSCVRKTLTFTQMKKKQWITPRDGQSIIKTRADQIAASNIAHKICYAYFRTNDIGGLISKDMTIIDTFLCFLEGNNSSDFSNFQTETTQEP